MTTKREQSIIIQPGVMVNVGGLLLYRRAKMSYSNLLFPDLHIGHYADRTVYHSRDWLILGYSGSTWLWIASRDRCSLELLGNPVPWITHMPTDIYVLEVTGDSDLLRSIVKLIKSVDSSETD